MGTKVKREFYLSDHSGVLFMVANGSVFIYSFYTYKFHKSRMFSIAEIRERTRISEIFVIEMLQIFHYQHFRR